MKKNHLQIGLAGMMLTATVLGTPAMAAQFSDVPANHWASKSISSMVDKGLLKGTENGKFAPSKNVTYAEFAAMLVRQKRGDQPMKGDKWYTVYWEAASNGNFFKDMGTVDPNASINRYDMALMLWNAGSSSSYDVNAKKPADWASIPEKYRDVVMCSYDNQIIKGLDTKGTFGGNTFVNRAQVAAILERSVGIQGYYQEPVIPPPPVVQPNQKVIPLVRTTIPAARIPVAGDGAYTEEYEIGDTEGYTYLKITGFVPKGRNVWFYVYNDDTNGRVGCTYLNDQVTTNEMIVWGKGKLILQVVNAGTDLGVKIQQVVLEKGPTSSNIPAGATQFMDVNNDPLIDKSYYPWNMTNLGNGAFECNANGMGASDSGIQFDTKGQYKTITCTFKNTNTKQSQYVRAIVPAEFNGGLDGRLLGEMTLVKPGETKTVTIDISGTTVMQLVVGDGRGSDGILSNVYLTK